MAIQAKSEPLICDGCGQQINDDSSENWNVLPMKCPKCGHINRSKVDKIVREHIARFRRQTTR